LSRRGKSADVGMRPKRHSKAREGSRVVKKKKIKIKDKKATAGGANFNKKVVAVDWRVRCVEERKRLRRQSEEGSLGIRMVGSSSGIGL